MTRRAESICNWLEAHEPKALRDIVTFHHRWLSEMQDRTRASLLWRLTSKRIVQTAVHLGFVSALFIASQPLYEAATKHLGRDLFFPYGLPILFWSAFGTIVLGPLIAIWRNVEALAMIVAEGATPRSGQRELLRPLLQTVLKTVGAFILLAWLLLLIPFGPWVFWTLCAAAVGVLLYAPLFWRRLLILHSRFEFEFREQMKVASTPGSTSGLPVSVLERPQEWDLQIDEVTLPFLTEHAGRRIADLGIRKNLGCSVLAIDRQGFLIANPSGDERFFAGDKLLLLGTGEQLAATGQFLRGCAGASDRPGEFDDIAMENLDVPQEGPGLGIPLSELKLVERFGIQVCGIQRGSRRILVPSSTEQILAGDRLLLLGTHQNIQKFRTHLGQEIAV